MKWYFFTFLIFVATQPFQLLGTSQSLNHLKRELDEANKEVQRHTERVRQLEEAIARKEISRIQQEVNEVKKSDPGKLFLSTKESLAFFYQQREILGRIIRKYPTCRNEAQEVLDQILTLITEISDASS